MASPSHLRGLLVLLLRFRFKLSSYVRRFLAWLFRRFRRGGLLEPRRDQADASSKAPTPAPSSKPSQQNISVTYSSQASVGGVGRGGDAEIVCASTVPTSVMKMDRPSIQVTPESPTLPLPTDSQPSRATSAFLTDRLSTPYSSNVPFATHSYQEVGNSHMLHTHHMENRNRSEADLRVAIFQNPPPDLAPAGAPSRVSSRAPSRYFGQVPNVPRSRPQSPAPSHRSHVPPDRPIMSIPNSKASSLYMHSYSSINIGRVPPSTPSLAFPETLPDAHWPFSDPTINVSSATSSTQTEGFHPPELPEGRRLLYLYPDITCRYEIRHLAPKNDGMPFTIPHLTTNWYPSKNQGPDSSIPADCGGWEPFTHPEGGLYFYHRQKRVFTDEYMYDDKMQQEIEYFADFLDGYLRALGQPLPSAQCDRVLELRFNDNETIDWFYYYVDHPTRSIFWLESYDDPGFLTAVLGMKSLANTKWNIESQYWSHCALYPFGLSEFSFDVVEELQGTMVYCAIDAMTSNQSTSPYTPEDLTRFIKLIRTAQPLAKSKKNKVYLIFCVARLMSFFAYWKYAHYHGEKVARLERDKSIFHREGKGRPRSYLISILSPLFFFAPETHLSSLEKIYIDQVICHVSWSPFISKLVEGWQEFVLNATVVLTASVSFLEVPYVGINTDAGIAQLLSYLTVAASMGSIVLGLMLIRHNRSKAHRSVPDDIAASLYTWQNSRFGLELIAIVYSLPYALLMWAVLTFVAAFLTICFQNSNTLTRISMGLVFPGLTGLVFFCIFVSHDILIETFFRWETARGGIERGKQTMEIVHQEIWRNISLSMGKLKACINPGRARRSMGSDVSGDVSELCNEQIILDPDTASPRVDDFP